MADTQPRDITSSDLAQQFYDAVKQPSGNNSWKQIFWELKKQYPSGMKRADLARELMARDPEAKAKFRVTDLSGAAPTTAPQSMMDKAKGAVGAVGKWFQPSTEPPPMNAPRPDSPATPQAPPPTGETIPDALKTGAKVVYGATKGLLGATRDTQRKAGGAIMDVASKPLPDILTGGAASRKIGEVKAEAGKLPSIPKDRLQYDLTHPGQAVKDLVTHPAEAIGTGVQMMTGLQTGMLESGLNLLSPVNAGLIYAFKGLPTLAKGAKSGKAIKLIRLAHSAATGALTAPMVMDVLPEVKGAYDAYQKGDYTSMGNAIAKALFDVGFVGMVAKETVAGRKAEKTAPPPVEGAPASPVAPAEAAVATPEVAPVPTPAPKPPKKGGGKRGKPGDPGPTAAPVPEPVTPAAPAAPAAAEEKAIVEGLKTQDVKSLEAQAVALRKKSAKATGPVKKALKETAATVQAVIKEKAAAAPTVTATATATAPAATGYVKLPPELAGAKPRYSFGEKQFNLEFESDIDKAAYIAAQTTPSKRDADYVAWLKNLTGMDEGAIRRMGGVVRGRIKDLTRTADGDTITVPMGRGKAPASAAPPIDTPKPAAPPAPQPAPPPASPPTTATAILPGTSKGAASPSTAPKTGKTKAVKGKPKLDPVAAPSSTAPPAGAIESPVLDKIRTMVDDPKSAADAVGVISKNAKEYPTAELGRIAKSVGSKAEEDDRFAMAYDIVKDLEAQRYLRPRTPSKAAPSSVAPPVAPPTKVQRAPIKPPVASKPVEAPTAPPVETPATSLTAGQKYTVAQSDPNLDISKGDVLTFKSASGGKLNFTNESGSPVIMEATPAEFLRSAQTAEGAAPQLQVKQTTAGPSQRLSSDAGHADVKGNTVSLGARVDDAVTRQAMEVAAKNSSRIYVENVGGTNVYDAAALRAAQWNLDAVKPLQRMPRSKKPPVG
jgi:hypothetical protein